MVDKSIDCVLCTYNGEEYILEQLESIENQSVQISRLIISDDGSTDKTIDIVKEWSKNVKFQVDIYVNKDGVGAASNFEKALSHSNADYIFFSDQDDVWRPNKIGITINKIYMLEKEFGNNMPCMVHTDLTVVDRYLNVVNKSFMNNSGLNNVTDDENKIKNLMVQNFVTGCTMVINRACKEKVLPFPKNIVMHDYWIALVTALVGKIGYVGESTILYRQHSHNTIGAVKHLSLKNIIKVFDIEKMLGQLERSIKQLREVIVYKNGILIKKHLYIKEFIHDVDACNMIKLLNCKAYKQGMIRNIVFKIYIVLLSIKEKRKASFNNG